MSTTEDTETEVYVPEVSEEQEIRDQPLPLQLEIPDFQLHDLQMQQHQQVPVMRQADFYKIVATEDDCVNFLRERGLLLGGSGGSGFCQKERNGIPCGGTLKDYMRKDRKGNYKKTLRCNKHGCGTFVSIRKSNKFFTYTDLNGRCNSSLSMCRILELCWMWANSYPMPFVEQLTGRAYHTIVEWYNYCREVCDAMYQLRLPMGGNGETVHVDEFLCTDKDPKTIDIEAKNGTLPDTENPLKNYGNRTEGPWIVTLSLICQEKIAETRFAFVPNRKAETLIPFIQGEVAKGTTILSDKWSAYAGLNGLGYAHQILKNPKIFIDPVTGKLTKCIDRLLDQIQRKYNVKNSSTNKLSLQLREEWWRSLNSADTFNAFLRDMKKVYYPDDLEESVISLLGES